MSSSEMKILGAILLGLVVTASALAQIAPAPPTDASPAALPNAPSTAAFPVAPINPPKAAQQTVSSPTSPPEQAKQDQIEPDITVNVKLVNLFVSVTDRNGAPIAGLRKEDFELFEDGTPEKVSVFDRQSELPLSIVMAIDTSLSTKKDLKLELESARRFAHSILRAVDRLSLYQFSEVVSELVPFTADLRRIDQGIQNVRVGSATAMYDALYLGSEALEGRRGRRVMVVITDGGDTVSKVKYREAVRAAQQSEAIVYSIVIVPIEASAGRDLGGEHALIQISRDTGGKHYYATSTAQLDAAFHQISEELRTQYLLAYYPSRRLADSDFRRFEVRIREGNGTDPSSFKVRYRAGYYTSNYK